MNRDEVMRMAREADLLTTTEPSGYQVWIPENLERFAALVYAEGHKDGLDDFEAGVLPAAIKAEREACAKVCMEDASLMRGGTPPQIALMEAAAGIRARGQG
jgi:hypothetical protein